MLYKNASKILPVSYPTITSWTWHASLFAMVENVEHAQDWIMSNYIQIQCRPDKEGEKLYFDFFPFYRTIFDCPALHTQYIDRKFVRDGWKDIKDFLIYCIENNYYVYCVCNEKYMLHCEEDFFHELFIYGYDCLEKKFNCADFTFSLSGKYDFSTISFEDLSRGMADCTDDTDYLLRWEGGFVLAKVCQKKENKYELDANYIKQNFFEYLNGVNSYEHFGLFYNKKTMSERVPGELYSYHKFGIEVYDALADYLKRMENASDIDLRPYNNLYEHKKLMTKRIAYFTKKGLLKTDGIQEEYTEIERESLRLRNAIIKYKIKGKKENVGKLVNSLYTIRDKEKVQLSRVLKEIL